MKAVTKINRDGSEQVLLGAVIMREKPARKREHRLEWKFSKSFQRLREIEKVIRHRHGGVIPDPAGTDDVEMCVAYLRAVALTPDSQDVETWSAKWAPWVDPVTLRTLADLAFKRRHMIKADAAAKLLTVTMAERTKLGLRTIGACDMTREERDRAAKEGKRERDRTRQERKRNAEGRKDRASYEAGSLSRLQPWVSAGMSRSSWYRSQRETGLSRIEGYGNGDTLVSKAGTSILRSNLLRSEVDAGLGDHPPAEFQEAAPHGNGDKQKDRAA